VTGFVLRRLLKNPYLLPASVILTVGIGGLFSNNSVASAQVAATTTSTTAPASTVSLNSAGLSSSNATHSALEHALSCAKSVKSISYPGPANNGSPNGVPYLRCKDGQVVAYGSPNTILYQAPPSQLVPAGELLFAKNCSSCHGADAAGTDAAPNLIGVGPATVDFWVTTGRMPAATPLSIQAQPKPPRLNPLQALEVAAYVNSLHPAAPFVPNVNTKAANLTDGASLYALNCAACHTITGSGDELAYGTNAPTLHGFNATQVASAIRTGPGNMPWFTGGLTDAQVRDITAYVTTKVEHPSDPGGAGLGGIGPVTEGFVGLLFGVGGLMLVAFWIGDRS
jgi:ubiquinol-cytochrome c reductase cytochrome c subunit